MRLNCAHYLHSCVDFGTLEGSEGETKLWILLSLLCVDFGTV